MRAVGRPCDKDADYDADAGLDDRLADAAARLRVSRSLLLREAGARGLKGAVDAMRREQQRHGGTNGDATAAGK
ncbi:MAG: hypothetical protein OXI74_20190 [Rhodospirillaceae bacterium]|nr:hypothetical protein [Rhodospirillaceae bacterium]